MKKREHPNQGIEKIITLGRQKGFLTYDEVNNLLPENVSTSEEIDKIFELLGNEDIQIIDSEEEKAPEKQAVALKDEPIEDHFKVEERFIPLDDPVKMYLKQMGSISLLSRENEIELAKKIEEAEEKFKQAALATRFLRRHVISVAEDIIEGRLNPEEVVKEDIKAKKISSIPRIKRIVLRLRHCQSETKSVGFLLQFNFTTSVVEKWFTQVKLYSQRSSAPAKGKKT